MFVTPEFLDLGEFASAKFFLEFPVTQCPLFALKGIAGGFIGGCPVLFDFL
jgi:hypothetical protein